MPDSAVTTLRNAENSALSTSERSYYTGNGRSANSEGNKKKGKGRIKNWIVAAILTGMLGGGAAFLSGSHAIFWPMFSANVTSQVNTQQVATQTAFRTIFKDWLGGTETSVTVPTDTIPDALASRMESNNFTVTGNNVVWTDTIHGTTTTITADNFDDMFDGNYLFRDDLLNAKLNGADFFDNGALAAYQDKGQSRNTWSGWQSTNNAETDAIAFSDSMRSSFSNNATSLNNYNDGDITEGYKDVLDENGNPTGEQEPNIVHDVHSANDRVNPGDNSTAASASTVTSLISKFQTVGKLADIACNTLQIGTMFVSMVAGLEMYNAMSYALRTLENISKTQYGYGSEAALNPQMNNFSTYEEAEIPDYRTASGGEVPNTENVSGTMMEDQTVRNVVSDAPLDKSATQNYSIERLALALGGSAVLGAGAAKACAVDAIANNIVSLAAVGFSFSTGGVVGIGTYIINKFLTLDTFTKITISIAIGLIIPAVARLMANFFDMTKGMSRGAVSVFGTSVADMFLLGKGVSAQTISSQDAIQAFNRENQAIIARQAEVDRKTHSPFDITNGNTFLGSIVQGLYSFTSSSRFSRIASLMRTTSSSLATLTGRVSASGEDSSYITTYGECPMTESVGGKGGRFCEPITVSDMDALTTIEYDNQAYVDKITENTVPVTDNEGNTTYKIKDGSNLAKYINFCDGRESIYGVVDYNILNADNIGNVVVNNMPVVGNAIGAFNSLNDIINDDEYDNFDWATGKTCGNTDMNTKFWESEGQYFQTYINAQRVYSQTGAYDDTKNPVYAYQEQYNAEHPKDTSVKGTIARYSGLTLEDTEVLLAIVDYYQFLEDYNAETRIAMDGEITTTLTSDQAIAKIERGNYKDLQEKTIDESTTIIATANKYIVYADVRNRSHTTC